MKSNHRTGALLGILFIAIAAPWSMAQQAFTFAPGETAIITLKSAEKFEGKVLSDSAEAVEIEVKITPKIKDRKTILKADIAEVKKQTLSETEFAERALDKLEKTPDLWTSADYESAIQDKLRTFVAKYPGTPEAAKAEKIIAALGDEKSKVVSGQIKMEGRWLDAATVKREDYNIQAYGQILDMRAKAAENNDARYLNGLRAFDRLRTEYPASPYFLAAVPEALELLKKFETQLAGNAQSPGMIGEAPILAKQRADGLKQLQGPEAQAARSSIAAEELAYKTTLERQAKDKVKWREISKYDVKGLQDALATVTRERTELAALDLSALQAEAELLMTVIRHLADQNVAEAATAFDKANKLPNAINRPLIRSLGVQLIALREKAKREQKAAAAPATAAVAPAPDNKAPSNPVAEALRKQEEEKKRAAEAGKGAPGQTGAASGDPSSGSSSASTGQGVSASSLMDTLNEYGIYIGGGLLVIILLAWIIGKRKKEKEE